MNEPRNVSPESLARDVLENLLEGCQVIGFDWTYLYVNEAVVWHAQRPREEMLGHTMMECFPGIELSPMFATLKRCMAERTHDRMLNEFKFPDETTGWFELRFIPVSVGMCVLSLDRTESKRVVAALARSEEQLRQMQKMEAIGRLAGGIAHDFNNLLAVILGYASFAQQNLRNEGSLRRDIEEIRKAGERGVVLTRQLLTFSRQQAIAPRIVDPNAVVRDILPMFRRLVTEAVELRLALAPEVGRVKVDPGQLEQVLMNLVVNARDALPAGGEIVIETQDVELDAEYAADHLGVVPGPYVMLAVIDNGMGMDRETQARMFEPFFTTKDREHGTGLGLTTVFGIVRQSRGSVWVYSEPGLGTTVKVYLPHAADAAVVPREPVRSLTVGGSETVLLVEDDDQLRTLSRSVLEGAGYQVLEAANGPAAIVLAEQHAGPIHLLLTDVVMPRMAGPDLAERINRRRPEIRIAFVSGYTEGTMTSEHPLARSVALLEKPLTPDALLRRVREVLDTPTGD